MQLFVKANCILFEKASLTGFASNIAIKTIPLTLLLINLVCIGTRGEGGHFLHFQGRVQRPIKLILG